MTTSVATPLSADRVRLIRPLDPRTHAALRRLAATVGARIEHGAITLGGQEHAALLAIDETSGVVVAALLLPTTDAAPSSPSPPAANGEDGITPQ